MTENVAVDEGDNVMAALSPDHLEHEKRYQRINALEYAIRIETIASKNLTDDPVAVRNRIFEHARRIIEFIEKGNIDSDVLDVSNS